MNISYFVFLCERNLFLTFHEKKFIIWNFKGQAITTFEDHESHFSDYSANNVFIDNRQDILISYCNNKEDKVSINVSDLNNGKCLARIGTKRYTGVDKLTALTFNEDRNELYSGTSQGLLQIWS